MPKQAWSTRGGVIESLPAADADTAQALLETRFAAPESRSVVREHNTKLIGAIFRPIKPFHNYWTKSDLPATELKKYICTTGWVGERCVAACVVRHVPPPRRHGPEHAFTEVLLLAVDRPHERQGHANRLLKVIREASAAAGSSWLLVRPMHARAHLVVPRPRRCRCSARTGSCNLRSCRARPG
jgi:hypothetical protein